MTTKEFIQITQPIVVLVTAVAKIKYGEHSEKCNTVMSSIMEAQARKDIEMLFESLNSVSWYINALSYAIEQKLEDESL